MRRALAALLLPFIVATAVGAVLLWPSDREFSSSAIGPPTELVNGTILTVDHLPCQGDPAAGSCLNVQARVTSGPEKGQTVPLSLSEGPGQPNLKSQDEIVLGRSVDSIAQVAYHFVDFQRRTGLIILASIFALLVVFVARWRGLGALIGLGVTWLVVVEFILPAILNGKSPIGVALTGGSAIVLTVLYVAHGFNIRTTTALIGTLSTMALTGLMAGAAVELTTLTGLASENSTYIQSFAGQVDVRGLLLAGIIIGSLGVLNDMTVTQASAVWEIHRAKPGRTRRELYRSGMRVGRDHIASTVYTLVLAYTGAALPLLILFLLSNRNFAEVATTSIVAEEVVRTLVGSLGLILCVPLTTALAAVAAKADHSAVRHNGRSASTSARTRKGAQGSAKAAGSPQREQAGNANQRGEAGRRGSPKHGKGDGDRNKARPTSSSDRSPKGRPVAKGDKNPKAKWGAPIGETLQEAESQRRPPPILPESPNISSISSVSKPKETKRVKRRWLGLRKARPTNFHETRKMTRRERKFWRDD